MSTDLERKVAFIEARLTLLERKFARSLTEAGKSDDGIAPDPMTLACDDPRLLIAQIYDVEYDSDGVPFCWVGNSGPIQFVAPVTPHHAIQCRMRLRPHPNVDFGSLRVIANDEERASTIDYVGGGIMEVGFNVPKTAAANININLVGVESIQPSESGENSDWRLLAARFFGMTLAYF